MNVLDLLTKSPDGTFRPKTDRGFVGLFVGYSGSGKDTAQASFAELGKVYVFDVDNRIRGMLSSSQWLGTDLISRIDYDNYTPKGGFAALDLKLESFLIQAQKRQLEYKTICINSTSSLVFMLAMASRTARGTSSGRTLDKVQFLDPSDYNFMSMAMRQMQFMYAMPLAQLGVNVIFSGHLADRWAKPPISKELGTTEYSPNIVIGQKLLGPDKYSEEIPGYFDEVYLFSKQELGSVNKFSVKFSGEFAKTALPIAGKELDLTHKSFYSQWKALVDSTSYSTSKLAPPSASQTK